MPSKHGFSSDSFSGTTQVGRYQKGKTNPDFTEARDSEWQWHQLGHMQVCTSLQTDNHANTPPLSFLQAGCHSCRPTNSVKALQIKNVKSLQELKKGKTRKHFHNLGILFVKEERKGGSGSEAVVYAKKLQRATLQVHTTLQFCRAINWRHEVAQ